MRTRLVILMAAMAIIASGCFKVDFTIDVNDDGSGTVEGIVAFNPDALGDLAEAFGEDAGGLGDDDLCAQLEDESGVDTDGFQDVRPYSEDGFCGTQFSGTFEPGEFESGSSIVDNHCVDCIFVDDKWRRALARGCGGRRRGDARHRVGTGVCRWRCGRGAARCFVLLHHHRSQHR